MQHSFLCSCHYAWQGRGGLMWCCDAWEQAEWWRCLQDTCRRVLLVGWASLHPGESSQAPCVLLSATSGLTVLRDVLSPSSWAYKHWQRMVQSHHVPSMDLARLIVILAVSTLTPSSQTSPCICVPGSAALASQCCIGQETCCWATPRTPAPGRVALSTQELLLITSSQVFPLPSRLWGRFASWLSAITKWGHVFTRAHMCTYFSLLPF